MRLILSVAALFVVAVPASADTEARTAKDFAGEWQMAFQSGEGVIVNETIISCEKPAKIHLVDENSIHAVTSGGDMGYWEVRSFSGKNPWWPEDAEGNRLNGENLVAKWTGANSFILASRIPTSTTGAFDYDNAKEWTRCMSD